MTKTEGPARKKSDSIALVIAKANQVAAIDWLHAILEEHAESIRGELAALRSEHHVILEAPNGHGVPRELAAGRQAHGSKAASAYWAKMTPEERSAEMQKRRAKWSAGKALTADELQKLHPRDKRSPRHAAWVLMMSKVQKRRFDKMTPRQRKQWHAAMLSGRINGEAVV